MTRIAAFATALAADTGLTYDAAYKWATAEVGANNNLGIMVNGKPASYATPQEGAQAAAALINSAPQYAGIRASIGTGTTAELDAIAHSAWHQGYVGGTYADAVAGKPLALDSYYAGVFGMGGTADYIPTGPGAIPLAPSGVSSSQLQTAPWTSQDLANAVAIYENIPAAKRTAKQSASLATDLNTLATDYGSPQAAAEAVAQAMHGNVLPPSTPVPAPAAPPAQAPSVSGTGDTQTPTPAVPTNVVITNNPAPTGGTTPDWLGFGALALVGLVIVLLASGKGNA